MTSHLFLLIYQLFLIGQVNGWLMPCNQSGVVDCSQLSSDEFHPETISGLSNFTLSNCIYLHCPPITITNSTVNFNNVSFMYANATVSGGSVYVYQANVNMTNCSFIQSQSSQNGGAIGLSSAFLSLNNCSFVSCSSGISGGALYAWASVAVLNNVSFVETSAEHGGGAVAWQGANFTWMNGSCINTFTSGWGACYYHEGYGGGPFLLQNIRIEGARATMGAAMFLNNGVKGTIRGVTVKNTSSAGQGGCLYSYSHGETHIYDSLFDGCSSPVNAGFAYVQSDGVLNLIRTTIRNSTAAQQGGAILISERSTLNIISSTIITGFGSAGALVCIDGPASTLTCSGGSLLANGVATIGGGAIYAAGSEAALVNISVCQLINNTAPNGGALLVHTTGVVQLGGGTVLSGNSADQYGAGISLNDQSRLVITHLSNLTRNAAGVCGGAISMSNDHTNVSIVLGDNAVISDNTAPKGAEICIMSSNTSYFGSINNSTASDSISTSVRGTLWVEHAATAMTLQQQGTFHKFPGLTPSGKAAQLNVLTSSNSQQQVDPISNNNNTNYKSNTTFAMNITVGVREILPNFTVSAQDVFGNLCPVIMNSPVIVLVEEISGHNVTLVGETAKAILNTATGAVVFAGLVLDAEPGSYDVQVSAVPGTIDHIEAAFPYPLVHVTVDQCDSATASVYIKGAGKCFPVHPIGTTVFAVCGSIGIVFAILSAHVVVQLQRYKSVRVVKANSVTFLSLACAGSSLALLSLPVFYNGRPVSCVVAPWFENLGFTFVFAAILLKTFRIKQIFEARDLEVGRRLSDHYLLRYFLIACGFTVIFFSAATIMDPPYPVQQIVYNSFVTVDRCSSTYFQYAFDAARLLVQLVACWFAFSVRNVHADFNESRFILFATYNWAIFGAMVDFLARFVVVDPVISFLLHSVAVVVPNVLTVVLLGGIKVFQCMFLKEQLSEVGTAAGLKISTRRSGATSTRSSGIERSSVAPTPIGAAAARRITVVSQNSHVAELKL